MNNTAAALFAIVPSGICTGLTPLVKNTAGASGSITVNPVFASQACSWDITTSSGNVIYATLTNSLTCPSGSQDTLKIYNGNGVAPTLYSGCQGAAADTSVVSTGSEMLLKLTTAAASTTSSSGSFEIDYTIYAVPSLTVTAPEGGQGTSFQRCANVNIAWRTVGVIDMVDISLYSVGSPLTTIVTGLVNTGSYNWLIPCDMDIGSGHNFVVSWHQPTRIAWWKKFCGGGTGCAISASMDATFAVTYCSLCEPDSGGVPPAGLTSGQSAGVAIGVILGLGLAALLVFGVWYKNKNGNWPVPSMPSMPSMPKMPSKSVSSSSTARQTPSTVALTPAATPKVTRPASMVPSAPKPSASARGNMYRVNYDYDAGSGEELTLRSGDTVNVLKIEGEWAYGALGQLKGYFPANYITKM